MLVTQYGASCAGSGRKPRLEQFSRAMVLSLVLLAPAVASKPQEGTMPNEHQAAQSQPGITIRPTNAFPASSGDPSYFTGQVQITPLIAAEGPSRLTGALVSFEPGARTKWHVHPLGQTLIVTEGSGWVQQWGQPPQPIRAGDVVRIPPGVKHWHGATATTRMTHLALQEQLDGRAADWMEEVTDEQYPR